VSVWIFSCWRLLTFPCNGDNLLQNTWQKFKFRVLIYSYPSYHHSMLAFRMPTQLVEPSVSLFLLRISTKTQMILLPLVLWQKSFGWVNVDIFFLLLFNALPRRARACWFVKEFSSGCKGILPLPMSSFYTFSFEDRSVWLEKTLSGWSLKIITIAAVGE